MTLQEAKDETARNNGWENWKHIHYSESLSHESKCILADMAAILYAKSKWEDAIDEMRAISELDSDCELPKFEA